VLSVIAHVPVPKCLTTNQSLRVGKRRANSDSFYASIQTNEAEGDPNRPTGKTNPDAWQNHN